MKHTKFISLLSCIFLLSGCGDNNIVPHVEHKNPDEINVLSGEFEKKNDTYRSHSHNAFGIYKNQTFKDGSLSVDFSFRKGLFYNGYTFLMNDTGDSYYFVGVNYENNVVLNKVCESKITTLYESDIEAEELIYHTYMVYFDEDTKYLEVAYDGQFLTSIQDVEPYGDKVGFYGGNIGTNYTLVQSEESNVIDNDSYLYDIKSGDFNEFESLKNNSILVNESKEMENGTIEVEIKLNGTYSDNGIIFALNDNGKEKFWETNVSYYFLFISLNGDFHLGKVDNGIWSNVSIVPIKNFDNRGTYKIKVVKLDNKIFGYLDDELTIVCSDAAPLNGTKWGLRSGSKGIAYSNISASTIVPSVEDANENTASGKFSEIGGVLVSEENKSLKLYDETIKNGTIEATISPGTTNDSGIIFRVSKPEGKENFYEKEEGLSYYWFMYSKTGGVTFAKYKNGLVERLKDVYLPFGTSPQTTFKLRIVMNEGDIYCYFDDRLSAYYHDDDYLTGEYFGVKAAKANCVVTKPILFENVEVEKHKTLIFGHSYTEFWKSYKEDFVGYEDIGNVGLGGSIATHWSDGYNEEIPVYEPELGIYWIGINDLTAGISPAEVNNSVKKLLLEIKSKVPNFEVALLGCNRCPARTNIRTQIHELNILFQELAKENQWIHYVETEYLYCDSNGNELAKYFTDGLHPTHDGYLLAVEEINKVLKK